MKRFFLSVASLGVLVAAGCKTPDLNRDDLLPPAAQSAPATMPTYAEIVSRYNARLIGVEAVSCRTQVEAVWRNEKGRVRSESGKGRLIVQRPLNTLVTVEALGQNVMWAGSNDREYWLFSDLHQGGELVFGRFGRRGVGELPMPVSPSMIPLLLGLTPLPTDGPGSDQPVESLRGYALIEPPGLGLRMLLDVETASPVRVDLLDATGASAVVCRLEGRQDVARPQRDDMTLKGGILVVPNVDRQGSAGVLMPASDMPDTPLVMPRAVTMYPVNDESRLTLELTSVVLDDPKVKPHLFDLETLRQHLKPDRVIDLDAP